VLPRLVAKSSLCRETTDLHSPTVRFQILPWDARRVILLCSTSISTPLLTQSLGRGFSSAGGCLPPRKQSMSNQGERGNSMISKNRLHPRETRQFTLDFPTWAAFTFTLRRQTPNSKASTPAPTANAACLVTPIRPKSDLALVASARSLPRNRIARRPRCRAADDERRRVISKSTPRAVRNSRIDELRSITNRLHRRSCHRHAHEPPHLTSFRVDTQRPLRFPAPAARPLEFHATLRNSSPARPFTCARSPSPERPQPP